MGADLDFHMKKSSIIIATFLVLAVLAISPIVLTAYAATGAAQSSSSAGEASPTIAHVDVSNGPAVTCSPTELCPSLMQTAYGVNLLQAKGVNGTGQKIVIVDACEQTDIASDLKTFDSQFGLPNPTLNVYFPQGSCTTNYGWGPEISLDVEWSHVMAPAATINLVIAAAPTTADLTGAWNYSLSNHLGSEISNSWTSSKERTCPGIPEKSLLATAAADHVTVLAATGDSGAWPSGPGFNPANCIGVLGVGGTSLDISSAGKYISESAWSGGGGGYASKIPEPSYQSTVQIKDPNKLLGKPDVSADANPDTGVWIVDTQDYGGWSCCWGGTSLPTPMWAGFFADVNQIRASNGYAPLGLVTPFLYLTIYGVNGTSVYYKADIHDVKTGSNGFPAGKGWDAATGIGSYKTNTLAFTLGDNSTA